MQQEAERIKRAAELMAAAQSLEAPAPPADTGDVSPGGSRESLSADEWLLLVRVVALGALIAAPTLNHPHSKSPTLQKPWYRVHPTPYTASRGAGVADRCAQQGGVVVADGVARLVCMGVGRRDGIGEAIDARTGVWLPAALGSTADCRRCVCVCARARSHWSRRYDALCLCGMRGAGTVMRACVLWHQDARLNAREARVRTYKHATRRAR